MYLYASMEHVGSTGEDAMLFHIREFFAFLFGWRTLHVRPEPIMPGFLLPSELEQERQEMQELDFVRLCKRRGFLRQCMLYPVEQRAEHRRAQKIAEYFRDRWRGRQ